MSKTKTKKKELTVFKRADSAECYHFGMKSDGSIWQLSDDNEPCNMVLSAKRVADLAYAVSERARIIKLLYDLESKHALAESELRELPDTMDDDAQLGISIEDDGSMVEVGCNKVLFKAVMRFAAISAKLASKFKGKSKKR